MSEKKKELACSVESTLENELLSIDEKKLPLVFSGRLRSLEETNRAYDTAKIREKEARDRMDRAVSKADALITKAKEVGKNIAKTHSFLGFEWTNESDEIEAVKKNLQEMIECGIESAEAQKEFVEVQSALAESQAAILNVQETEMAYQRQIADVTKFLYGLSAYNMSSVQSVLINLEAVLSGASKEKLGEMAQQQLLLAMDQLKNQENIVLGMRENRKLIDDIDSIVGAQGKRIENILRKDSEQDARLKKLENADKELVKKGRERDKLLRAGEERDKKQDLKIVAQAKKNEKQDRLLQAIEEHDKKQDLEIAAQTKKDEEQDRLLRVIKEHDKKQDLEIATQTKKDEEQDRLLRAGEEHDKKQDLEIAAQAKKNEEQDRLLQAIEEYDKKQDLEIIAQAKKDEEHDKNIKDLLVQYIEIQKKSDEQAEIISHLKNEIEGLKEEKAEKLGMLLAYAIAGVSLILAIIQLLG